jgi:hypothetical protein
MATENHHTENGGGFMHGIKERRNLNCWIILIDKADENAFNVFHKYLYLEQSAA